MRDAPKLACVVWGVMWYVFPSVCQPALKVSIIEDEEYLEQIKIPSRGIQKGATSCFGFSVITLYGFLDSCSKIVKIVEGAKK